MLVKIMEVIGATLGIMLLFILAGCLYFVITAPDEGRYSRSSLTQLAEKQVTISSDESDFVTESRLQEKLSSAEIDREVALFDLQNHSAKKFFAESGPIDIMTPMSLVHGKRNQPGKISPEMQK